MVRGDLHVDTVPVTDLFKKGLLPEIFEQWSFHKGYLEGFYDPHRKVANFVANLQGYFPNSISCMQAIMPCMHIGIGGQVTL